jgi:hypothetical protein
MNLSCPLCRRNSWLTVDGLAGHLVRDHGEQAVAGQKQPPGRCTKLPYPNEHEARIALVGTVIGRNRGKTKRRERRVYPCKKPGCNAYHLTSQPIRGDDPNG